MAAEEKVEGGNKKMSKQDQSRERVEPEEEEEEEPDFSDPEDYIDDISDQGNHAFFPIDRTCLVAGMTCRHFSRDFYDSMSIERWNFALICIARFAFREND